MGNTAIAPSNTKDEVELLPTMRKGPNAWAQFRFHSQEGTANVLSVLLRQSSGLVNTESRGSVADLNP